jgi:hypothetical protein
MSPFEVFPRQPRQYRAAAGPQQPTIGIMLADTLSMDPAAWGMIGQARHVELWWDADTRRIGISPAGPSLNAYVVTSANGRNPHGVIGARAFLEHIGQKRERSVRREAHKEGEMIYIDLNEPGRVVGGGSRWPR